MKVGTTELILILVVALVVFGPSKLPELGKLAGQAVGSFKKYLNTFEGEWDEGPQKGNEAVQSVKETPQVKTVTACTAAEQTGGASKASEEKTEEKAEPAAREEKEEDVVREAEAETMQEGREG